MNSFILKHNISCFISWLYGVRSSDKDRRVLMYHSLKADVIGDVYGIYQIDELLFSNHIQWLDQLNEIKVVALESINVNNNSQVVITFDEGYRDTLNIAAEILEKYNMPFTVFISPGLIQSGDERYMDEFMLRELTKVKGCSIGAHGYTHKSLIECDDSELKYEIEDSKKWLEDLLSMPVNTMSYPYGAVNNRVYDQVKKAGYTIAATSQPGSNSEGVDNLRINRTDIWSVDDVKIFGQKVMGYWDWIK